jgi:hypothetical protein
LNSLGEHQTLQKSHKQIGGDLVGFQVIPH